MTPKQISTGFDDNGKYITIRERAIAAIAFLDSREPISVEMRKALSALVDELRSNLGAADI